VLRRTLLLQRRVPVRSVNVGVALAAGDEGAVDEERRAPRDREGDRERDPEERITETGVQRAGPEQENRVVHDLHRRDRERVGDERDPECRAESSARPKERDERQQVAEEEREHDRERDRGSVCPPPPRREDHAEHLADPTARETVIRRADGQRVDPHTSRVDSRAMFEGGLAELHTHLGGSVASDILWSLAHEQGIALPVKDYWEFDALVTVSDPRGVKGLDELDRLYHWTELIQSSPIAVERSVHAAIGGAYRSQGITTLELRFNPMKRNRGGERDLDHIILAAVRGLDRASLEYPQVRAGLILMMDRTFDRRLNEIIVEKAVRWSGRGIVGVDIAGPRPGGARYDYTQLAPLVETAREAGLGVTIHVGEEGGDLGRQELGEVLEHLRPERIGHGILAAGERELERLLRELGTVLEICPTSNLLTRALRDENAVRNTFRRFVDAGVAFTIATDGPEMMRTHLRDEFELLLRLGALDENELREANARGHAAAFQRAAAVTA
jgi:adenosine deaminase